MGYTNLSITSDIDTSKFFTETATILSSSIMQATISEEVIDLDDTSGVLIVPSYTIDGAIEANRIRLSVDTTVYVEKGELTDLFNALDAMGFDDLDSFGTGIDSNKFFTEKDTILLSSIMHATMSDQLLVDTAGVLIVPNTDVENSNEAIRVIVDTTEFITVDEIKALLDALTMIGLDEVTSFASIDISIGALFGPGVVFADMVESASVQATISDSFIDVAIDETERVPGDSDLVVTQYHRQLYSSGLTNNLEQIEETELINLLSALQVLGFENYGDSISSNTITSLDDAALTTILTSGSLHVTIDNMLAANTNISVPNKAYVGGNTSTPLYGINGLIQANEIKYFILAAKAIGGADFTSVDFDYYDINSLSSENSTHVLSSMIVRNMVTPDLVSAVNAYNALPAMFGGPDPVLYSPIPNNFYEDNDPLTFLTSSAILTLIDYLPL